MFTWPERKSLAVAPIVAWETWPDDLGSSRSHQRQSERPVPAGAAYDRNMWTIYDHLYAERQGVRRLLDIFDAYNIKATFVINGLRVERSPELAREVQRRGHEMSSENYVHEYPVMYSREEEARSLGDTVAAFRKVLGAPPRGYISPGHRPTPNTLPILFDLGYEWDADFQNDDGPFLIEHNGRTMVGMPYAPLSDYAMYERTTRSPRQLLEMLWDEFRVLRREGAAGQPRVMGYAMHPYLCHGFRTVVIEEFLSGLRNYPDAWVATRKEIADWVRQHPGDLPRRSLDEVLAEFPRPWPPSREPAPSRG